MNYLLVAHPIAIFYFSASAWPSPHRTVVFVQRTDYSHAFLHQGRPSSESALSTRIFPMQLGSGILWLRLQGPGWNAQSHFPPAEATHPVAGSSCARGLFLGETKRCRRAQRTRRQTWGLAGVGEVLREWTCPNPCGHKSRPAASIDDQINLLYNLGT